MKKEAKKRKGLAYKLALCTIGVGVAYAFYKLPPIIADELYYKQTHSKKEKGE